MTAPPGAPDRPDRRMLSLALLFLCGALYGLTFSLNRMAAEAGVPPTAYVFWQAIGAGTVLLLAGAPLRQLPRLRRPDLRAYLVVGTFGFIGPFGVAAIVASHIPVGVMALVVILVPLLTYAIVLIIGLERFGWLRLLGLALGVAGVLMLLLPDSSLPDHVAIGWVLLAMAVPLCLATTAVCMQTLPPPESPALGMAGGVLICAGLLLFAITAASGGWWAFSGPFGIAHGAVIGAALVHALMWPLAFAVVKLAGAFFLSFLDYIATLAGIGWGLVFFGEQHSGWIWGSLALMLIAVLLVNRTGPQPRQ